MKATHDNGKVHVMYVPPGMSLDDVLDEINVMGFVASPVWWRRLLSRKQGNWQVLVCDGDPCVCPVADEARGYVHRVNGEKVYDACDHEAFPIWCKARRAMSKVGAAVADLVTHVSGPWVS